MNLKTIALLSCLGIHTFATAAEYRKFTDAKGRTLSAELIRYNDLQKKVTIKCKGKGIKTVPVSIFSETDQKYIASWNQNQDFLSEKKLLVEFKRRKRKNVEVSYSTTSGGRTWYECNFNIELTNKSTTGFDKIELEYVVFYSQDHYIQNNADREERHGTLYKQEVINLPKKSTKEFETEKILLFQRKVGSTSYGKPDLRGEVHGIILNISMKSETGETISRQIKYPDNLNHVWTSSTKNVQIAPY
ncbi:MAG: hypothetical protein ABFR47_00965 [Verrucomicrobiota bacterium]